MAEKPSGYRLEYATSNRATCKGPKPCAGTKISKGELRVGSMVDFRGNTTFAWRHWGCTTKKIIENMKKQFDSSSELDGYEDLKPEDQQKVDDAWERGEVADEDIPATARKPAAEGEAEVEEVKPKKRGRKPKEGAVEKPKKARASKNTKVDEDEAEVAEEEVEEKTKKPPTARKPRTKKAEAGSDQEAEVAPKKRLTKKTAEPKEEAEAGSDGEAEVAPKKRLTKKTAEPKEKAAPKKRVPKKKEESGEESGEDFTAAVEAVPAGESADEDEEEEPKPKKKKAVEKKPAEKEKVKRQPKKVSVSSDDDEDMEDIGEDEGNTRKRKKPTSKSATSKPASKRSKPTCKA